MIQDIDNKITWIPYAGSWLNTFELLKQRLEEIGYTLEIKKTGV